MRAQCSTTRGGARPSRRFVWQAALAGACAPSLAAQELLAGDDAEDGIEFHGVPLLAGFGGDLAEQGHFVLIERVGSGGGGSHHGGRGGDSHGERRCGIPQTRSGSGFKKLENSGEVSAIGDHDLWLW